MLFGNIAKPPNLLIFRGLHTRDFVVTLFEDQPRTERTSEISYSEIPKKFTSVESWPKSTNLLCWECDLLPESYPKFVPMNPEIIDGVRLCDVHGNFCEWNCVIAYIQKKFPTCQHKDLKESACIFESLFTGKRRLVIMESPAKTKMKAYCGKSGITPKQWREEQQTINTEYSVVPFCIDNYRET